MVVSLQVGCMPMGFKLTPKGTFLFRFGQLIRLTSKIALCLSLLGNSAFLPEASAIVAVSSTTKVAEGVRTTTFETSNGKLTFFLPEDIQPQDFISGTIEFEPAGNSDIELKQNGEELAKYVLELKQVADAASNKDVQTTQPIKLNVVKDNRLAFSFTVSEICTKVVFTLHNPQGEELAFRTFALSPKLAQPMEANVCYLPQSAQTGHVVTIGMINDGHLDDFSATVLRNKNLVACQSVASSPRAIFIRTPRTVVGPLELTITKADKKVTAHFNNLEVTLSCPKTAMQKGEHTELTITVRGLSGLTTPVKLNLENRTPQVVQISGGNTQSFTIPGRKPVLDDEAK